MDTKKVQFITIDEAHIEQRLDNFLIKILKGVPRSRIYRLIRKGEVRVNKKRAKQHQKLLEGDIVRLPPITVLDSVVQPKPSARLSTLLIDSILFEDERLLVLNKPGGLAVHGGSGVTHSVIGAMRALRADCPYLELVHRLDRDTSGCLVLAKKRSYLRFAHEALRNHDMKKVYLTVLCGQWEGPKHRMVEAPLKKNTLNNGERVVRVDAEGKDSRSDFMLIEQFEHACLVKVRLFTGRTHQIRVHAQHIGLPILGDEKYGKQQLWLKSITDRKPRLFLHAAEITVPHPEGHTVHVKADTDTDWEMLLNSLREQSSRTT